MSSKIAIHEKTPLLNSVPVNNQHGESSIHQLDINGLTIFKCAVFIVAQMAGSGILALPDAISGIGWTGIFLLLVFASLACYCGVILGKCWIIVRRNNEIPGHVRDPYPLIGYYAAGKKGKYLVEFCVIATLIGASVVFLLLSSREVASILNVTIGSFDTQKTEFRIWILICGCVLIPCTWFASPKEMWLFAYAASACTVAACVLISIRASIQIYYHGVAPQSSRHPPTIDSFFGAFGTIAFSFGGGAIFPTFQSDMKRPSKFVYAAILGFSGVLILYLPVAVLPYVGFGSNLESNILQTLKNIDDGHGKTLVVAAECLITFHLLFAIIIINNPISQQFEEHLGIEHKFGFKRIMVRTLIMIMVMIIAELIPNFGPILSFMGASTITMMSFILPTIFYLLLQEKHAVSLQQKVFHFEIVIVAVLCGCCGMYSAVQGFSDPFKA